MDNNGATKVEVPIARVCHCNDGQKVWPGTEVPKKPPSKRVLLEALEQFAGLACFLRGNLASFATGGERPEEPFDKLFDRAGDTEVMRSLVVGKYGAELETALAQLDNEHCLVFLAKLAFAAKVKCYACDEPVGRRQDQK